MFGRENHRHAAAVFLADIERGVGAFEHLRDRRARVGKRGPADRARQLRDIVGDLIRLAERIADTQPQLDQRFVRHLVAHEHAEFIAAQTREHQARFADRHEPCADFLQHEVAACVTVNVVDLLEAVQIDEADVEAATGFERLLRYRAQRREETAPVRQAGQTVDAGEPVVVVAEPLGVVLACLQFALRVHRVCKRAPVKLDDHRERDADQRHVDGHREEHRRAARHEEAGETQADDAKQQKRGLAQMDQAEHAADQRRRHIERDLPLLVGGAIRKQQHRPAAERDAEHADDPCHAAQFADSLSVRHLMVAFAPPAHAAKHTQRAERAGHIHRQPGRRAVQMRRRHRRRVDEQDEVEKRYLAAERVQLRTHQLPVTLGDRQYPLQSRKPSHRHPFNVCALNAAVYIGARLINLSAQRGNGASQSRVREPAARLRMVGR
ncbi:hypothetical protein HDG37_006582 [Paraburkholderia sp. MM5384-R2]|nr:hypothetical protein [Paraburkholderia sp. MM5384-R2]